MTDNLPRVLFTEGVDDEHIVRNLLLHNGFPVATRDRKLEQPSNAIQVKGFTGYNELLKSLPKEIVTRSQLTHVGVVVDCDRHDRRRWESVTNRLASEITITVPAAAPMDGFTVTAPNGVRIGVWLMPDNVREGAIEHFYRRLIRPGDALLDHADGIVKALPHKPFAISHPEAADAYEEKAIIHTWLAWQESPGRRMGEPIRGKLFDLTCAEANGFVGWARALFQL